MQDSLSLACTFAHHVQRAKVAAGVKFAPIVSMYRDIQDVRVVVERSLGAVAVVDIPPLSAYTGFAALRTLFALLRLLLHQGFAQRYGRPPSNWRRVEGHLPRSHKKQNETHQSRINTFFAKLSLCTSLAATATLLKKQKPICSSGSA